MQEWVDLYQTFWSRSKNLQSRIIRFRNSWLCLKVLNLIKSTPALFLNSTYCITAYLFYFVLLQNFLTKLINFNKITDFYETLEVSVCIVLLLFWILRMCSNAACTLYFMVKQLRYKYRRYIRIKEKSRWPFLEFYSVKVCRLPETEQREL